MKYSDEEALAEILRRSEKIRETRNRRSCRNLSVLAGVLCVLLITVIVLMPGGGTVMAGTVYGAFLLSPEAGGYILSSVIAFALGVVVTLLIHKKKNTPSKKNEKNDEEENS